MAILWGMALSHLSVHGIPKSLEVGNISASRQAPSTTYTNSDRNSVEKYMVMVGQQGEEGVFTISWLLHFMGGWHLEEQDVNGSKML